LWRGDRTQCASPERRVKVSDDVRRTITAWFGDDGRRWCDAAPGVANRLAAQWKLRPGAILPGATHALVLACTRADGSPAVLKLPFVDEENRAEADALRLYDGDGAFRLLDHDPESGALLLERLVPGRPLVDLPDRARALDIACGLLHRLRHAPPKDHRFPLLRDLAAAWATNFSKIGRMPFTQAAIRARSSGSALSRSSLYPGAWPDHRPADLRTVNGSAARGVWRGPGLQLSAPGVEALQAFPRLVISTQ